MQSTQEDLTEMFIAALFKTAPKWNNPDVNQLMNWSLKMQYITTMKYSIPKVSTTWMTLKTLCSVKEARHEHKFLFQWFFFERQI